MRSQHLLREKQRCTWFRETEPCAYAKWSSQCSESARLWGQALGPATRTSYELKSHISKPFASRLLRGSRLPKTHV